MQYSCSSAVVSSFILPPGVLLIINRKKEENVTESVGEKTETNGRGPYSEMCRILFREKNGRNDYIFLIHQLRYIKINLGMLRLAFVG
jgi:hypothetical protein